MKNVYKTLKAENYSNLIRTATEVLEQLIEQESDSKIIVATNCISLVAGLSFNVLKKYNIDFAFQYGFNDIELCNKKILFIIGKNDKMPIQRCDNLYFEYIGKEEGVIWVEETHR